MDKIISVVIPVYNLENYISDCLDSVIAQTYDNLEVILVNDGSTDMSEQICRKYIENDNRIKLISQKNGGLSAARNTGTSAATGDYIAYVDGDDILHKDYFKTLIDCAEKNNADIAVVRYVNVDNKEEFEKFHDLYFEWVKVITAREAALLIEKYNKRYMITAWGKIYKSSLKDKLYFPVGKLHEDEFVTYKALYSANKVVISGCRYYGYLKHGSSITGHFTKKRMEDALEAMKGAMEFFSDSKDNDLYCWSIRRYLFRIVIDYYRTQQEMPDDEQLAYTQRELFMEEYNKMYPIVKKGLPIKYFITYNTFKTSPEFYCLCSKLYLKFVEIMMKRIF